MIFSGPQLDLKSSLEPFPKVKLEKIEFAMDKLIFDMGEETKRKIKRQFKHCINNGPEKNCLLDPYKVNFTST